MSQNSASVKTEDNRIGSNQPLAKQAPEKPTDVRGFVTLPAQAVSYFEQFPAGQFVSEHEFNPEPRYGPTPFPPRSLPLPSQLLGSYTKGPNNAPESEGQHYQHQQDTAQWSTQQLNPIILQFRDPEVEDRLSSGGSVLDESAIVGESGRTYHGYKDGQASYLLPNDAAEQDRLDFQHAMMAHLWGGRLVLAPLPRAPKLVLDVATGTGVWPLEFARANPTSFVVGTDLSKIQPVPDVPNCLFERLDCEDDWMWTYKFDYIHIRMIVAAIRDPKRLIRQAFESLNPGGWIEMQDADMDLVSEEGPQKDDRVSTAYLKRWFDLACIGAALHGIDMHKPQKYKEWLIEAGFVDVVEEKFQVACAPWPKDPKAALVGQWMRVNFLSGLRGVGYKMLRSAGMEPADIEAFIAAVKEEVKHGDIRGYTPWYAVYGRKPFDWEARQSASLP